MLETNIGERRPPIARNRYLSGRGNLNSGCLTYVALPIQENVCLQEKLYEPKKFEFPQKPAQQISLVGGGIGVPTDTSFLCGELAGVPPGPVITAENLNLEWLILKPFRINALIFTPFFPLYGGFISLPEVIISNQIGSNWVAGAQRRYKKERTTLRQAVRYL